MLPVKCSQMDKQAVVPDQFSLSITGIKKETESAFDRLVNEDEEAWASFGESPFFDRVKKYFNDAIELLDKAEDSALENGVSISEIGVRRVVNKLTASTLMSLISKIEATTKAVHEKRTGGK